MATMTVMRQAVSFGLAAALCSFGLATGGARAASPYVVANYPVDATASDAVAAKSQGTAEAEQGAFRYLLKRLVPVTAYRQLPKLPPAAIENLLDGVSVRAEQNSGTEYIATLDFSFRADAVRGVLQSQGLPYLDRQAPVLTVIPVYAAPAAMAPAAAAQGQKLWRQAWAGLDLVNGLTPLKLAAAGPSSTNDTFLKLLAGDRSRLGIVQAETSADKLLLAVASPSADGAKLTVGLIGEDWAGPIDLRRSFTLYYKDLAYTSELVSVISLGTLEGRWKQLQATAAAMPSEGAAPGWAPAQGSANANSTAVEPIRVTVEFASLQEWRDMRAKLAAAAGEQNVQIGAISARGAEVMVGFPGGPDALQSRLSGTGLSLARSQGHLVLRAGN